MLKKSKGYNGEIDINIEKLLEEIYKEYGESEENHGRYFSFDDYIRKKFPSNKEQNLNYNIYKKIIKKYGTDYKNIVFTRYNNNIYIHIKKITSISEGFISIRKVTTVKSILIIFSALTLLALLTLFLGVSIGIYNTIFVFFLTINLVLFFVYGIEIILIITGLYFIIKNTLLIFNSLEIINLPYIKYFDPNIYSYCLILICLIISVPIIINFLCLIIDGIMSGIMILKGRNVENYNELLKKTLKIELLAEIIIIKYKEIVIKVTTIRGIQFDFFIINKYKMFMYFYILTAVWSYGLLNFDFNTYYYSRNNGYCSNIGNKTFINNLDKNENIVHVITTSKLYNHHPLYTFNDISGNTNYVYETKCERGVIIYNQEKIYSIDDVLNGFAPLKTKINVYGNFIDKNLLSDIDNKKSVLTVKFDSDKIFSEDKKNLAIVLLEIVDKEFIVYKVVFIDDKKSIIDVKKDMNKDISK